jgi:hypothetical protein
MSKTRSRVLVLAGLLATLGAVPATAMGRRAECRKLCGDALERCHRVDELKRCRRQVRAECRRSGPQTVCRPSYSGDWTFTPTGELTDDCGIAAKTSVTELTRMVVVEETFGDGITAEFGPGRDRIVGYVRQDDSTILEGEIVLDGCVLGIEVFIEPSTSLPRNAVDGSIRSQGTCGERRCLFQVDGRWDWQRD